MEYLLDAKYIITATDTRVIARFTGDYIREYPLFEPVEWLEWQLDVRPCYVSPGKTATVEPYTE